MFACMEPRFLKIWCPIVSDFCQCDPQRKKWTVFWSGNWLSARWLACRKLLLALFAVQTDSRTAFSLFGGNTNRARECFAYCWCCRNMSNYNRTYYNRGHEWILQLWWLRGPWRAFVADRKIICAQQNGLLIILETNKVLIKLEIT